MTILTLDYISNSMQNVQNTGRSSGRTLATAKEQATMSIGASRRTSSSSSSNSGGKMGKRPGKRPGRKPSKIDERAKLERSRQSARECRARKKLRYQYLEELVINREKAVFALRDELETFKQWCLQMDGHGTVPEGLVKLIAKENMDLQQKQMQESQRAIQQQQQRMMTQLSSTSSSSSNGGTSPNDQQQLSQRQVQHRRPVDFPEELQKTSPGQQTIPNLSPTLHPSPTQSGHVSKTSGQPILRRQMAIDVPSSHVPLHIQQQLQRQKQQQQQQIHQSTSRQNLSHPPSTQQGPVYQQRPSMVMVPGPSHQPTQQFRKQLVSNISQIPSGSGSHLSQGSPTQTLPRVKSEPPLRYSHSLDTNVTSTISSTSAQAPALAGPSGLLSMSSRVRSASNPASMVPGALQQTAMETGRERFLESTSLSQYGASINSPFGNYSQTMRKANVPPSFLDTSDIAPIKDVSPSEDVVMDNFLFQNSSSMSQKRTMSETSLQGNRGQFRQTRSVPYPVHTGALSSQSTTSTNVPSSSQYDPYTTLNNLTNVHCFSSTRTSNTPSPAPYGLIPIGGSKSGISSSFYQTYPNTTPSSSTTSSPAPLSSISSFLELADPSIPSAAVQSSEDTMDQSQDSSVVPFTGQPVITHCASTGLSASISEPIPEWYSFLADLHEGSRQEIPSGHGTPMILTPKSGELPGTPDSSFMNVPNIIDDLLGHEDNGSNQS